MVIYQESLLDARSTECNILQWNYVAFLHNKCR